MTRTALLGFYMLAIAVSGSAFASDAAKACQTAKRKVEREQRSLATATATITRDRHARATCVSRSACARYDAAIADTERRSARITSRLGRFEAEAASACG